MYNRSDAADVASLIYGSPQKVALDVAIIRYTTFACLAWQIYDIILTFPEEVDIIWSGKMTFVKVVYILERYCALLLMIYRAVVAQGQFPDEFRHMYMILQGWSGLWLCSLVEVILIFQVSRIYERNRKVLIFLATIFFAQMVVMTTVLGVALPLLKPMDRPGKWFMGCFPTFIPCILWGFWVPVIMFHTVILFMAVTKSLVNGSMRAPPISVPVSIFETMARDGIFSVVAMISSVFIETILWSKDNTILVTSGISPSIAVGSVLGCRLILDFPCLKWPHQHAPGTEPEMELSIHFAKNPEADDDDDEHCTSTTWDKSCDFATPLAHLDDMESSVLYPQPPKPARSCIPRLYAGCTPCSNERCPPIGRQENVTTDIQLRPHVPLPCNRESGTRQDCCPGETQPCNPPEPAWLGIETQRAATDSSHAPHQVLHHQDDGLDGTWDEDIGATPRPRRTHQKQWKSDDFSSISRAPFDNPRGEMQTFRTVRHPASTLIPAPSSSGLHARARRLARFRHSHTHSPSPGFLDPPTSNPVIQPLPTLHSRSRLSLFLHRNRSDTTAPTAEHEGETRDSPTEIPPETDRCTPLGRSASMFSTRSTTSGRFRRMIRSSGSSQSIRHASGFWNHAGGRFGRDSDAMTIDTVSTDWPVFDVDPRNISDTPDMA